MDVRDYGVKECSLWAKAWLDILWFAIPRMGKRVDAILISSGLVFVLEFKIGATHYHRSDQNQVVDYALDLKNFHEGSHRRIVVPILVATDAQPVLNSIEFHDDGLANCLLSNRDNLCELILRTVDQVPQQSAFDAIDWALSRYMPTPTIVEAAQALYKGHDVHEISRSEAGAKNLSVTAAALNRIIETSKRECRKAICFVTGVPGAGKSLAGLNITIDRMRSDEKEHAVFLSGNRPLVEVLREALTRDEVARLKVTRIEAMRKASAFIQNVHHFRDTFVESDETPIEKVVVFDEAQRAWNRDQAASFMKRRGLSDFDQLEPEFLIQVMDRHDDWCVIIALIGGGQEINTGEVGLPEWFSSLKRQFRHWDIYYSDIMDSDEYIHGGELKEQISGLTAEADPGLHFNVSVRSFRSERVSEFVHHVISNEPMRAREAYSALQTNFLIAMTRDLDAAKWWVRNRARGGELFGILASSRAKRLKPFGINVNAKISPAEWFLNGPQDVRSCHYLEDVGSEFEIQGLELDWCCIGWDADLRYSNGAWDYFTFRGTQWKSIRQEDRQRFLQNTYRVLLTRARQGFVIFLPPGSAEDFTRNPAYYDGTYEYLHSCGIPIIDVANLSPNE